MDNGNKEHVLIVQLMCHKHFRGELTEVQPL